MYVNVQAGAAKHFNKPCAFGSPERYYILIAMVTTHCRIS